MSSLTARLSPPPRALWLVPGAGVVVYAAAGLAEPWLYVALLAAAAALLAMRAAAQPS